jgi:hypothetical protein
VNDSETTRELGSARATAVTDRAPAATRVRSSAAHEDALVMDRYRLVALIGRGGHGSVWEAIDERLEREVAVKVVPRGSADGGVGPRAEREGRVAARLNHPGIVALYELGSDEVAVYLVSELVRGRTVAELSSAGALSDSDVARVGLALCSALAHAHERGVVHRDVKPQNVLVVAEPAAGAGFAKLTDFGVARLRGDDTLTRTGDVVGTFAYMAPEQAEGGRVTAAADVYALALLLYEGWTGSGPDGVVAARLAGRALTSLARVRGRELPLALCRVIDAALDPRPEYRPSLAALAEELETAVAALSEEGGLVEPATRRRFGIPAARPRAVRPLPVLPRWVPRIAAGLAAGGAVALALDLLGDAPAPPLAVGAAAVGLVALLPRIGWMLVAVALLAWLALPGADRQGIWLVAAVALAPVPLLLPRAGALWTAPALAPLLGAAALAPLFVALAGLAPTAWRRIGLALAGFGWLAAMELLRGSALLFGAAGGVESPRAWDDSALGAARDALYPEVASLALVPALVWAALALALGLLVRGRSLALDAAGAVVFAVAVVAGHAWLGELLAGTVPRAEPRGLVAGATLGAALAFAIGALRRRRRIDSEREWALG